MKQNKQLTIFFQISLIAALSFIFTNGYAQQLEVGAFLGKYRNFGYVYSKSESSTRVDQFRSFSSFKEGGGILSSYYFKNNFGVRGGLRYVPAEFTLEVRQNFFPVIAYRYFWTLKSKVFQIPIGVVYRLPMNNGQKNFKVFMDATADVRHFNVELNKLPSLTVGSEPPQSVTQSFSFTTAPKTKINAGADFGFGLTPFKCKNIELNVLYHYSFSYLDALDYYTQVQYTDMNNEVNAMEGTGTIRIRPNYVMAQLVYYFISR